MSRLGLSRFNKDFGGPTQAVLESILGSIQGVRDELDRVFSNWWLHLDPYPNLSVLFSGTSPVAPNTDFTIAHGLGAVPTGYWVVYQDKAAVIYASPTAWDSTNIVLRCDTASTIYKLYVVI